MSVHVSKRVWEECPLSGNHLLVLLALAEFADDAGTCWPSQKTIAARARCTDRWVKRIIDSLNESGDIEILSEGGGRGNPAKYRLSRYQKKGEDNSLNKQFGEFNSLNGGAVKGELQGLKANCPPTQAVVEPLKNRKRTIKENRKDRAPRSDVVEFVMSLGATREDGEHLFDHWEEVGWKRGGEQIKDWKAGARKWHRAGWLPSQKNGKSPQNQKELFIA